MELKRQFFIILHPVSFVPLSSLRSLQNCLQRKEFLLFCSALSSPGVSSRQLKSHLRHDQDVFQSLRECRDTHCQIDVIDMPCHFVITLTGNHWVMGWSDLVSLKHKLCESPTALTKQFRLEFLRGMSDLLSGLEMSSEPPHPITSRECFIIRRIFVARVY